MFIGGNICKLLSLSFLFELNMLSIQFKGKKKVKRKYFLPMTLKPPCSMWIQASYHFGVLGPGIWISFISQEKKLSLSLLITYANGQNDL